MKATPRLKIFLALIIVFIIGLAPTCSRADMEDYTIVKLQSLDKVTARTMTFEVKVGSTVKFGPLYIKARACRKAPPIETPESAAFLQIWEISPEDKAEWIFSGWMFASSPALSPMDHAIYDVWVLDCLKDETAREKPDQATNSEDSTDKSTETKDKAE